MKRPHNDFAKRNGSQPSAWKEYAILTIFALILAVFALILALTLAVIIFEVVFGEAVSSWLMSQ